MTSPVEIKPVRIGDPKIRSKITFEVVTARVIESGGKKHVVRFLCFILFQCKYVCNSDPTEQSYKWFGLWKHNSSKAISNWNSDRND